MSTKFRAFCVVCCLALGSGCDTGATSSSGDIGQSIKGGVQQVGEMIGADDDADLRKLPIREILVGDSVSVVEGKLRKQYENVSCQQEQVCRAEGSNPHERMTVEFNRYGQAGRIKYYATYQQANDQECLKASATLLDEVLNRFGRPTEMTENAAGFGAVWGHRSSKSVEYVSVGSSCGVGPKLTVSMDMQSNSVLSRVPSVPADEAKPRF